jgi:hypothetical protein
VPATVVAEVVAFDAVAAEAGFLQPGDGVGQGHSRSGGEETTTQATGTATAAAPNASQT